MPIHKLNIVTKANHATINFCSPVSNSGVDGNPCGRDRPLKITNSSTGELSSPNHPAQYPNHAECELYINVDDGFVVKLTFVAFDVEEG